MKPYVIKQGDYLLKLAHLHGFDADQVWNDGHNGELRSLRKDPSMLRAGDVLFVPDEPKPKLELTAKENNVFVARVPSVRLSVVVSEDGTPLRDEKYVIEGLGDETEQVTDGEGTIAFEAPVFAREVTVRFVDRGTRMKVAIGDLDPPDTPSGARMRLTSLGYYGAKLRGAEGYVAHDEVALAGAVRAFQRQSGLDPSGELDEATRAALVEVHGS